ncbi:hypothetical protein ACXR2U_22580 [Jatrophihabitans sp. YIM 134969]
MTSVDEQQLALAAAVGSNPGSADARVAKLQGAVDRLNMIAKNVRAVAADIAWSGPSARAASDAFATLAGAINEHADALNAIAAADAGTASILNQAFHDHQTVVGIDTSEGHAYPGSGMVSNQQYRDMLARQAREQLDSDMIAARGQLVSAAAWDLDPPLPPDTSGGGVTGTIPDGVPVTTAPGSADPIPPVTGTVPPGSTSVPPTPPGGADPVPPVTGTVPYGSSSTSPTADNGVDPVGPVTGTVPDGDDLSRFSRRLG